MILLLIYVGVGVTAALALSISMAGAAHLTSRQGHGYLHWIFYAMMLTVALPILLSGRDMTTTTLSLMENGDPVRHPVMNVLQPLISLFMLAAASERIISHMIWPAKGAKAPLLLVTALILFWTGTVAAPAIFSAHPNVSHNYLYALVIGLAVLLATGIERDMSFRAARNALLIFLGIGILMIPVVPRLVLDMAYSQGLIPGLPRFAGLSAHPVLLGVLAQLSLLCLLACPLRRQWLNRLAWGVGLFALVMAQSKTSWISFILCSACLLALRKGPNFMKRATDPLRAEVGITAVLSFMATVLLIALVAMFGDISGKLTNFFSSSEGSKLASFTGRDQIWAIAYQEWLRNPVFGYGPTLWNEDFRTLIGMPNASHGHNQFMDTLARSGSVGATALVLYALVLLVVSIRYIRVSGGLTLALFLALALRSVSEVPLLMFGYGSELITHVLLLMTLAAAASVPVEVRQPASASSRGFAYSPRISLGNTRITS